jgi:hypothetical protein
VGGNAQIILIESVGWIGSVAIVLAYALNMFKKLASDSAAYYILNIGGSICLIVNTLYHHAIPSAVVNVIWIFIALVAVFRRK